MDEPGTGKDGDPKEKPMGDNTTSLMQQLLSALEKYGKQGEPSKGEEILPQLLLRSGRWSGRWSASSTLAGVKTMRRPRA